MRASTIVVAALMAAAIAGCTAVKVVTHTTETRPLGLPAGTYHLDAQHWSVVFDVDHLHYTRFAMRFDRASATLDFVPADVERSHVQATIDAASVDTNVPALDVFVTGSDMLDVTRYPEIRFESTAVHRTGPVTGDMTGNLTIHGVTQPVTLSVTFNGGAPNPLAPVETLGFSATATVDRAAYGLTTWYPAVGNDIRITIQAEFDQPR